jgi:aspartate/methionine/tyrosine aminotransferase
VAIHGAELAAYVRIARETNCTLILDEFYSQFMYNEDGTPAAKGVSGAEYIDDVNADPILLIDGAA